MFKEGIIKLYVGQQEFIPVLSNILNSHTSQIFSSSLLFRGKLLLGEDSLL